jgi:predicted RND superfamily exporter protein
VGSILSVSDTLKMIYQVFYHEGDKAFNKIPEVGKDKLQDITLTDRSVIGVCMNQFSSSKPDMFGGISTPNLKLLQFIVFIRSDTADFLDEFTKVFYAKANHLFKPDDPYVEKIIVSGLPAINMTMNKMLFDQQIQSILITIAVVFIACMFIFQSYSGAFLSIIPITITLIVNLGIMGWAKFPINYGTVIIASIAIGAGIDYTIHFMERFKYEHKILGHDFEQSYENTLRTVGKAIAVSAFSVAGGFSVLILSTFKMLSVSGMMVAFAMLMSALASLTILPALIGRIKPEFLAKKKPQSGKIVRLIN